MGDVVEMVVHLDLLGGSSGGSRLLDASGMVSLKSLLVLNTPGDVGDPLVMGQVGFVLVHGVDLQGGVVDVLEKISHRSV